MHAERAVPAGTNFPKGKLKVFLFYFLYFTKSRKKAAARRRKDLSLFVRSRHCGVLIRGLLNLETFRKGNGFILFACTKRTGSTPEVCEPLDSGDDSKLCRKRLRRNFRRHMTKPVLPTKRRRKGFESVQKGYRSADARPMFFEKELLYYKLTVGCRG